MSTAPRRTLLDAIVVVLLMALVLSILDDTFADRSYLVAGLVPVVVLLGLAPARAPASTRACGGTPWVPSCSSRRSGALVALRRPGPLVLPTLETMNRVLGECVSAPTTLVSTVAPVDASGQVMLVPFVIGFLAARSRRLAGARDPQRPGARRCRWCSALGGHHPGGRAGADAPRAPGHRPRVSSSWSGRRCAPDDARRSSGVTRGSLAAAATAWLTVALVSLLASFLVPDDNEVDRVLLRGEGSSGALAGAADSVLPSARGRATSCSGRPACRRDGGSGSPCSTSTTDRAGCRPSESPGHRRLRHASSASARTWSPLHDGRTVDVRIQIRPGYSSDWLPMLGELTSLDLDYTDGRTQLGDVRYNQATSSALVVGGVDPRDDYTFVRVLTDDDLHAQGPHAARPPRSSGSPTAPSSTPTCGPSTATSSDPSSGCSSWRATCGSTARTGSPGPSSQEPVDLGRRLLGVARHDRDAVPVRAP